MPTYAYLGLDDKRCKHPGGGVRYPFPEGLGEGIGGRPRYDGNVVRRARDRRRVEQCGRGNDRRRSAVAAPHELHAHPSFTEGGGHG